MNSLINIPPNIRRSLGVCLLYGGASVAISLLNKTLLSSYSFSCFFFMLACQLMITLSFCIITRDYLNNPFRIPYFDSTVYKSSIPMATAYIFNVCIGLAGLQLVNVPMFFAIRRTASAFILIYEYIALSKVADKEIQGSVGVIVLGALVAGFENLNADLFGYFLTCLNNLATAAASVMQKQFSEHAKLGGIYGMFGIMYYQALTALPACITISILRGEIQELMIFPYLTSISFWLALFCASIMGLILSYASLLSTTLNSPLATSITGNAKDVILTVAGAIFFPGFTATLTSIGGLLLSFTGSGLYSYISLRKALAQHHQHNHKRASSSNNDEDLENVPSTPSSTVPLSIIVNDNNDPDDNNKNSNNEKTLLLDNTNNNSINNTIPLINNSSTNTTSTSISSNSQEIDTHTTNNDTTSTGTSSSSNVVYRGNR